MKNEDILERGWGFLPAMRVGVGVDVGGVGVGIVGVRRVHTRMLGDTGTETETMGDGCTVVMMGDAEMMGAGAVA